MGLGRFLIFFLKQLTNGRTYRQTDTQTDRQTDGRTDGRTEEQIQIVMEAAANDFNELRTIEQELAELIISTEASQKGC